MKYTFLFLVKMYALFLYALPYWYRSANSICVVAMGAIRFSVCVASVAHTFLILKVQNELNEFC